MKRNWGIMQFISVKAFHHNQSAKLSCFVSPLKSKAIDCSLYLTDHNSYLYLGGNSSLNGMCYVPMGSVNYRHSRSDQTSKAKFYSSNKNIIDIDYTRVKEIYNQSRTEQDSLVFFAELSGDSIIQKFEETTLRLHSNNLIILDKFYSGNIIIQSSDKIIITAKAKLKNVIVIAPVIKVDSLFSGIVQLIATDSLMIDNHCNLLYPSALITLNDAEDKNTSYCEVRRSKIHGAIMAVPIDPLAYNKKDIFVLLDHTEVAGDIFVNGFLEISGKVQGSIICNNLIYQDESGSAYANYLENTTIVPLAPNVSRHSLVPHKSTEGYTIIQTLNDGE